MGWHCRRARRRTRRAPVASVSVRLHESLSLDKMEPLTSHRHYFLDGFTGKKEKFSACFLHSKGGKTVWWVAFRKLYEFQLELDNLLRNLQSCVSVLRKRNVLCAVMLACLWRVNDKFGLVFIFLELNFSTAITSMAVLRKQTPNENGISSFR